MPKDNPSVRNNTRSEDQELSTNEVVVLTTHSEHDGGLVVQINTKASLPVNEDGSPKIRVFVDANELVGV